MKLVTVKLFDDITHTGLVQSYLESQGIETFVKGEYMGMNYSGLGVSNFRIKLQVREEDAPTAIGLLIEADMARPEDYSVDDTMLRLSKYYEKFSNLFKRKKDKE